MPEKPWMPEIQLIETGNEYREQTMDHIDPATLSEEGKKLYRHFNNEVLRLEHRIAFQNKTAASSYLKTREQVRIDEIMGSNP